MDPFAIDLPPRWLTPRLVLRAPTEADAPAVHAAIDESFDALQPWVPWAKERPTPERTALQMRRLHARFLLREDLTIAIFERDGDAEGRYLGGTGLHRIDWVAGRFEIGYWRRSGLAAGTGFVDEAVRAVARIAFDALGAVRVEIRADARNAPSRRVAERCGFAFEGVLRCGGSTPAGAPCDLAVYSRVRGADEPEASAGG